MTPSPADLARTVARPRPPQVRIEEAIAVGVLGEGERFKPMYHWGLLLSDMQPEARLLGYTLLWYAHHTTGRIAPAHQPSRDELADRTGLSASRIGVQIEVLRQRGWLRLATIPDGPRAGGPRFDLTIPALYLERIRVQRAKREEQNRHRQDREPGRRRGR